MVLPLLSTAGSLLIATNTYYSYTLSMEVALQVAQLCVHMSTVT